MNRVNFFKLEVEVAKLKYLFLFTFQVEIVLLKSLFKQFPFGVVVFKVVGREEDRVDTNRFLKRFFAISQFSNRQTCLRLKNLAFQLRP